MGAQGQMLGTRSNELAELSDARLAGDDHHIRFVDRYRQVAELGHVEMDPGVGEELFQDHRAIEHADLTAVARAVIEDMIAGDDAAGARHVSDGEGGVAGDVPAQMARDQP